MERGCDASTDQAVNYTNSDRGTTHHANTTHGDRLCPRPRTRTRHGAGHKLVFGYRRHRRSRSLACFGDVQEGRYWPLSCRSAITGASWVATEDKTECVAERVDKQYDETDGPS